VLRSMWGLGVVFLVIALVAALIGFGVVSDDSSVPAKMFSIVFLVLAVASFGWGGSPARTRPPDRRRPAPGAETAKPPGEQRPRGGGLISWPEFAGVFEVGGPTRPRPAAPIARDRT
jgi:uncharacterized membrane protein YtjA (UPF0391 family)